MRLDGKVSLVTGAARGVGKAVAVLFAREGARVVVTDILAEAGAAVAEEIVLAGGEALFIKLDVAREDEWETAITQTARRFGRLDILVNNAGIIRATPIEYMTLEEWEVVMAINAGGAFLGTKHVVPLMRRSGGGAIVNISSTTGLVGSGRGAAYGTSKAAVRVFTKYTAAQHAKDGIRANSIHPGPVDTELISEWIGTPEGRRASTARVPLGRIGTVDDVAYGALFLASDEASFITGAELIMDGGLTAQ